MFEYLHTLAAKVNAYYVGCKRYLLQYIPRAIFPNYHGQTMAVYTPNRYVRYEVAYVFQHIECHNKKWVDVVDSFCTSMLARHVDMPNTHVDSDCTRLYNLLFSQAGYLASDWFNYKNCVTAQVAVTPNPSHTIAMLHFTVICHTVYPLCIPIYINFNKCTKTTLTKTIFENMKEQLANDWHIVPARRTDKYTSENALLCDALARANKYVFLILNHVDEMYRVESEIALQNILEMKYLSTVITGRIITVMCVSSKKARTMLYADHYVKEYPLTKHGCNLNRHMLNFCYV